MLVADHAGHQFGFKPRDQKRRVLAVRRRERLAKLAVQALSRQEVAHKVLVDCVPPPARASQRGSNNATEQSSIRRHRPSSSAPHGRATTACYSGEPGAAPTAGQSEEKTAPLGWTKRAVERDIQGEASHVGGLLAALLHELQARLDRVLGCVRVRWSERTMNAYSHSNQPMLRARAANITTPLASHASGDWRVQVDAQAPNRSSRRLASVSATSCG